MSNNKTKLPDGPAVARIRTEKGVPRLYLNGVLTQPTMLAAIHDAGYLQGVDKTYESVLSEMERSDRAGNRIVRTIITFSLVNVEAMKKVVDDALGLIISHAPNSYIFLSFSAGSDAYGIPGADPEKDHFRHHSAKVALNMMMDSDDMLDTNTAGKLEGFCSLASLPWIEQAKVMTAELVRYVRSVPEYARRVIGYMPCAGSAGEWFGPLFFEGATDGSYANTLGFRTFLQDKYSSDEALAEAWGKPGLTFDEVTIPDDIPGAGVERIKWESELSETLILTPEFQPYADYEDYYSGMVADRIISLCQVIKEESGGDSLAAAFYGYHSEVRVPFSGSFGLYKIKASGVVDVLGGPVSYKDRDLGGMGAYMSPTDSLKSSNILWLDEGDYRTHYRSGAGFVPGGTQEGVGDWIPSLPDENATLQVERRQFGKDMVNGTGSWWMDLVYRGWFDYDNFWKESVRLTRLAEWFVPRRAEASPEIAIVYDEEALNILGQPWQYGEDMLNDIRLMLFRMGYSFGMFSTRDVLAGKTPETKLYLFLTPWRLSEDDAAGLKKLLAGKTACWCYGNGLTDPDVFADLTGFRLTVAPGAEAQTMAFNNESPLAGVSMELRRLSPVYSAENGTPWAEYSISRGAAAAELQVNGYRSVFLGGTSMNGPVYCGLADLAGAHRYFCEEDVSYLHPNLAVLHASASGTRTLRLPEEADVYDYFNGKEYPSVRELTFETEAGQTHYFFIGCDEHPPVE